MCGCRANNIEQFVRKGLLLWGTQHSILESPSGIQELTTETKVREPAVTEPWVELAESWCSQAAEAEQPRCLIP